MATNTKVAEEQPRWLQVTGTQGGGIFGAPIEGTVTSHPGRGTKSSIEGGIFGAGAYANDAPTHVTPRLPIEKAASGTFQPEPTHMTPRMPVDTAIAPDMDAAGAGMATAKSATLSLAWNENAAPQTYTQAPLSARHNPNASSISGGEQRAHSPLRARSPQASLRAPC